MRLTIRSVAAATLACLAIFLPPCEADPVVKIDLITNANLGFGQLVATTTSGTVTVSPSGGRSTSGGVVLGSSAGVSAAAFTVTGHPLLAYSITLPSSCSLSGGGSSMNVDTFTTNPSQSGVLGSDGTQAMTLGAKLHVAAMQPKAVYSGTYTVVVNYN